MLAVDAALIIPYHLALLSLASWRDRDKLSLINDWSLRDTLRLLTTSLSCPSRYARRRDKALIAE